MRAPITRPGTKAEAKAVLAGVALLMWGVACSSGEGQVDGSGGGPTHLGAALPPSSMRKLLSGGTWTYVSLHEFVQKLDTESPIAISPASRLEFLPLVTAPAPEGAWIETFAQRGGQEVLLSKDPALPIANGRLDPNWTQSMVSIDLSEFAGEALSLKWTLVTEAPYENAAIAMPRLHRPAAESYPDVLLICSDTHRFDLSVGEVGRERMPELTRLIEQGVLYNRTYSSCSWTLPSLASVLTGLPTRFHRTGEREEVLQAGPDGPPPTPPGRFLRNSPVGQVVHRTFPTRLQTLGERLREQGYRTAMVVSNPLYTLSGLHSDGQDIVIEPGVKPGEAMVETAAQLLEWGEDRGPLFLLVHLMDVHQWQPWYLDPEGEAETYSEQELRESYLAAVEDTDRHIGQLLSLWDQRSRSPQSLVAFFSDHGENLNEDGIVGHGNGLQEALLHVPLVIRYPSRLAVEPAVVDAPNSLVDLFATVLEVCALPSSAAPYRGRSLLGSSRDHDSQARPLFTDYQLYGPESASVRHGEFKLCVNTQTGETRLFRVHDWPGAGLPREELVDDPQRTAALMRLREKYLEEAARVDSLLELEGSVDPEAVEAGLRELGYAE